MKDLLKFLTCGSVDDGKSTLIGHLLYEAKLIFADQESMLSIESKLGSNSGEMDYSLLLDGLSEEREQGITIDVAYRYFSTKKRSFIVADTPGHEEYTRNMAVGASFAELAVILVDVSKGIMQQTRRHARICTLMGIRHFVFAVNKMDLISYNEEVFKSVENEIHKLMAEFEYDTLEIIPVSATKGDNITTNSSKMNWYRGKALLPYLEEVELFNKNSEEGFVLPVQRVCRPNSSFRGFQGEIARGKLSLGEEIFVLPSKEHAFVTGIFEGDKKVEESSEGKAVTITLDSEIDISRGNVIYKDSMLSVGNAFVISLLWMDDNPLVAGRNYYLSLGTQTVPATITKIRYQIDVNTGDKLSVNKVEKNELAICELTSSNNIIYDLFKNNKELGSCILIDRISNHTAACGVVIEAISNSRNLVWQDLDITKTLKENQMGQRSCTIWFTGLSGAGKSTIANELEKLMFYDGYHTIILDGDNIRTGLNKDLGFSIKDREENIRRIAEVSKLLNDAGIIVLVAFISPFEKDREKARQIIGDGYFEVYVNTPLSECEARDKKGLYNKAKSGQIESFTGISSPYEIPVSPDMVIETINNTPYKCAEKIYSYIKDNYISLKDKK